MLADMRKRIMDSIHYGEYFLHNTLVGLFSGIFCGLAGCAFLAVTNKSYALSTEFPWSIFFLPLAGLLIVFLYHRAGVYRDRGTNMILESVRTQEEIKLRSGILIFIATALTHLCGGSSGREGACLQIGGSVGQTIGRLLHMDKDDMRMVTLCGMSGLFTALLGTPLTATIFSMEVITVGVFYYNGFIPCLMSALVVYAMRNAFGFAPETFVIEGIPDFSFLPLLQTVILGIGCALVSIIFCCILHAVAKFLQKRIPNAYLRIVVGGILIILLTLLVGNRDYNVTGFPLAHHALEGHANPEAFLLKMIFTAITLGAGFKGGEIVPTFCVGATFGNVFGSLLGLPAGFSASLGMIGLFCGVVNCPITSLLLSIEMFGAEGLIYYGIICGICYVLSGYYSLYSSQTILYSKIKHLYVNKKAE